MKRAKAMLVALSAAATVLLAGAGSPPLAAVKAGAWKEPPIPCASARAVTLGRDLDGDGDPDEIDIHLEVDEIQEEVYPGQFETFWVFAPEGAGMCSAARVPSPTIRVEEGDRVRIHLHNTHYLPHTIHLHGTIHPNAMDGVPDITQAAVKPGESFTYEFVAKQPGTFWYHCHVQPDVHVLMGLVGMFIIEPNRPHNNFRHLIVGAGRIPDLARAEVEQGYAREYSLVYMDIDDRLNRIPAEYSDPQEIERRMHREYDSTARRPNVFLLNGRSFPFTLRDTPIDVRSGERVKLRILNAGARTVALHTHGHHPTLTHLDGYPVPPGMRYTRDVFTILPAQRVDLDLRAGSDSRYASGPGVWLVHDHTEQAVTNNGIGPGGDLTAIVYDGFTAKDGLPRVATSLKRFFDPDYYRGKIPRATPEESPSPTPCGARRPPGGRTTRSPSTGSSPAPARIRGAFSAS
jgi:FtsP/CotA-like multicopper oxidase with cupredoxin domain